MSEHRVDLAGLRRQIRPRHHLTAVVARHIFEQPLELGDVAVDRLLELAVGAILGADLVERLLALQRVKPLGEHVAFAALVAVPQVRRGVMIESYDQMIGEGNEAGNATVQKVVDSLLNQTKEIERAVAALDLSTIKFEGSDSLDDPNKVMEENKSAGVAAPASAQ